MPTSNENQTENVVPLTLLSGGGADVFSKLHVEDWKLLFERGELRTYDHNDLILMEGQTNDSLFFISDGEVCITVNTGGHNVTLATLQEGSVFGEMSLLDKADASADVVALGRVKVVRLDEVVIKQIMIDEPTFGARFYHSLATTLSRRLRSTNRTAASTSAPPFPHQANVTWNRPTIDPNHEARDLTPALVDLVKLIAQATHKDSPGGVMFTEDEKRRYQLLRQKLEKELADVDNAVAHNQFLPVATY